MCALYPTSRIYHRMDCHPGKWSQASKNWEHLSFLFFSVCLRESYLRQLSLSRPIQQTQPTSCHQILQASLSHHSNYSDPDRSNWTAWTEGAAATAVPIPMPDFSIVNPHPSIVCLIIQVAPSPSTSATLSHLSKPNFLFANLLPYRHSFQAASLIWQARTYLSRASGSPSFALSFSPQIPSFNLPYYHQPPWPSPTVCVFHHSTLRSFCCSSCGFFRRRPTSSAAR